MKIILNGQPYETEGPLSVSGLLDRIGFGARPCVVELNEQAVFPREYEVRIVEEGSKVEVVTLAAGG